MARARNIKPSFFQNEELGELSAITRLAFIGMWTIADYKGCIEFRPKRLKVQIMPYDDCDFEKIANDLDKSGLIAIYTVAGQRYIKIVNFEKHQNPHKNEREAGSDIPDLDENASVHAGSETIQNNPEENGTAPADSLFLNPSSLNPVEKPPQDAPRLLAFDQFWKAYPKKTGKGDAERAFKKARPNAELLATMLKAIEAQKKGKGWLEDGGKYIPNPATWLNGKRWEDEVAIDVGYKPIIPVITPQPLEAKGQKPQGLDLKSLIKPRETA